MTNPKSPSANPHSPDRLLRLAVAAVLEADKEFRANMMPGWEGDPLSDEIDGLRRIFEALPSAPPSQTRSKAMEIIAAIRRQLEINVEIAERDHPEGPIIDGRRVKGVAHSQDILAQHIRDHLNDLERSITDHYAPLSPPANPRLIEVLTSLEFNVVGFQWLHHDPKTGNEFWLDNQFLNGNRSNKSRAVYLDPRPAIRAALATAAEASDADQ